MRNFIRTLFVFVILYVTLMGCGDGNPAARPSLGFPCIHGARSNTCPEGYTCVPDPYRECERTEEGCPPPDPVLGDTSGVCILIPEENCSPHEVVINNRCQKPECTQDSDCPGGRICDREGWCRAQDQPPACFGAEVPVNGECVLVECLQDRDCARDEVCGEDSLCKSVHEEEVLGCITEDECPADSVCRNNVCSRCRERLFCYGDHDGDGVGNADYPLGYFCDQCPSGFSELIDDCNDQERFRQFDCDDVPECTTDIDCPFGNEVCINGECTPQRQPICSVTEQYFGEGFYPRIASNGQTFLVSWSEDNDLGQWVTAAFGAGGLFIREPQVIPFTQGSGRTALYTLTPLSDGGYHWIGAPPEVNGAFQLGILDSVGDVITDHLLLNQRWQDRDGYDHVVATVVQVQNHLFWLDSRPNPEDHSALTTVQKGVIFDDGQLVAQDNNVLGQAYQNVQISQAGALDRTLALAFTHSIDGERRQELLLYQDNPSNNTTVLLHAEPIGSPGGTTHTVMTDEEAGVFIIHHSENVEPHRSDFLDAIDPQSGEMLWQIPLPHHTWRVTETDDGYAVLVYDTFDYSLFVHYMDKQGNTVGEPVRFGQTSVTRGGLHIAHMGRTSAVVWSNRTSEGEYQLITSFITCTP